MEMNFFPPPQTRRQVSAHDYSDLIITIPKWILYFLHNTNFVAAFFCTGNSEYARTNFQSHGQMDYYYEYTIDIQMIYLKTLLTMT